jgi:hypothetical protein
MPSGGSRLIEKLIFFFFLVAHVRGLVGGMCLGTHQQPLSIGSPRTGGSELLLWAALFVWFIIDIGVKTIYKPCSLPCQVVFQQQVLA